MVESSVVEIPRRRRRRSQVGSQPLTMNSRKIRRMVDAFRSHCDGFGNQDFVEAFIYALEQKIEYGESSYFDFIKNLKAPVVSIETFLDSDQFMGATDLILWPEVRKAIIELNAEWWKGKAGGAKTEFLGSGATGTGKSEIAKVSTGFHAYILGCMNKPQNFWGIPTATSILIPIFAAKPKVTKNILYAPLRAYIKQMPWFRNNMMFDKYMESEMIFKEQNIRITPVGADVDMVLGEALCGAMIDEVNFMQIVENSRKIEAKVGRSARYDQAEDIFNKVTRRKASRFTRGGPNVGVICTMSATSHPGEFTEVREKEVIRDNLGHVYVYNKAQYDVKPNEKYTGDVFHVCVHTDSAGTIELKDFGEALPKHADIYDVPIEEYDHFLRDSEGSVRDIIGRSLRALNPFITRSTAIVEAIELGHMGDVPNMVQNMNVQLELEGMPKIYPGHYCKNASRPRYVHIDLSHTDDRCGIAMLRFDGMAEMVRQNGDIEKLPTATVELAISIQPSVIEGLDIAEVRMWVSRLKADYGYPINVVSYDGWNSLESRQQWKKGGMTTVLTTVDKTEDPYKAFREALYDGRIALPDNEVLEEELRGLEHDKKKHKIDHPPNGTKDIADAVCGAYWVMLKRSHTWRSEDDGGRVLSVGGRYAGARVGGQERA